MPRDVSRPLPPKRGFSYLHLRYTTSPLPSSHLPKEVWTSLDPFRSAHGHASPVALHMYEKEAFVIKNLIVLVFAHAGKMEIGEREHASVVGVGTLAERKGPAAWDWTSWC